MLMSDSDMNPYERAEGSCPKCGKPAVKQRVRGGELARRGEWNQRPCDSCQVEEERSRKLAEADVRSAERKAIATAHLMVPPLYATVSLETFQMHGDEAARKTQGRILQLARRYVGTWPDVPLITVFQGKPGTGKGHLLWSIAKAVAQVHGETARVAKLGEVIRDLRHAWHAPGDLSEAARLAKYRQPAWLALDEVSRHAFYGEPKQHLYDLLDAREEQMRPTIITTNESGKELEELLGPALMSRCMGWGSLWNFGDADYRIVRGKQLVRDRASEVPKTPEL